MKHSKIVDAIRLLSKLDVEQRVAAFNAISSANGALIVDVAPDPACSPQLFAAERVTANNYNPNVVADPELDLLDLSMKEDGITMCVVVGPKGDGVCVVDGFHRNVVAASRLGRRYIVCSVIHKSPAELIASTIRHNRARGKHQVDLMGAIVRRMLQLGLDDEHISVALGMSSDELLRLKQVVGVARALAAPEYNRAWRGRDGEMEKQDGSDRSRKSSKRA